MATNNSLNVGLSGATGTGSFVGSTSPTLVTPVLGTPTSGTLTNCTGLPAAGLIFSGVSVNRSANQTISTATFTKVQLNSETYDTASTFDNATNYRWTPNVAGKYLVTASIYYLSLAVNSLAYCSIYKNGSVAVSNLFHTAVATDLSPVATGIFTMNGSTDYLELFAYHNSGVNKDISNLTTFQGYFLGT